MSSASASELIYYVFREGLLLVLLASAPPLIASLAVGIMIGLLQATTQVHDHVIAFVPKLIAIFVVLIVMSPVLSSHVVRFFRALLLAIPLLR
jgi:flagellar biosynthesis protein FliQ